MSQDGSLESDPKGKTHPLEAFHRCQATNPLLSPEYTVSFVRFPTAQGLQPRQGWEERSQQRRERGRQKNGTKGKEDGRATHELTSACAEPA